MKPKLVRITTVPISLEKLLEKQLAFMSQFYEVIAISSDEVRLRKFAEEEGLRSKCIHLTRTISPLSDLKALWKMYWFLKKERPTFVHSHTPKAGTVGMLAAFLAGVPYRLHTVAGLPLLETKGKKRWLLNQVERITYRCATMVYPNSEGLRKIIIKERLGKPNKLAVIGSGSSNGIDTSYFSPELFSAVEREKIRRTLNIDLGNYVFIFIGRLVGDKGINEMISAFSRLKKISPRVSLLLVGEQEFDLDPLMPDTIAEIENNSDIITTGYQKDVRKYLAISDLLVFPSYREGFPNVVMQAGSMCLPAIVSDINGCNEIISEGINGSIIPVKDSNALFERMLKFETNPSDSQILGKHARKIIVDRYEQKFVWNAILTEYKTVNSNDL